MQKILVISDTHGNQYLMRHVLQNESSCTHIVHLGDFYSDIENNEDLTDGKEIIRVPGIFHPDYFSQKVPFYQNFEVNGVKISCLHALQDLNRIPITADITLFGHTHKQELLRKRRQVLINPGHLKSERDRGYTASYCLIEFDKDSVKIKFKDYRCNLTEEFPLEI